MQNTRNGMVNGELQTGRSLGVLVCWAFPLLCPALSRTFHPFTSSTNVRQIRNCSILSRQTRSNPIKPFFNLDQDVMIAKLRNFVTLKVPNAPARLSPSARQRPLQVVVLFSETAKFHLIPPNSTWFHLIPLNSTSRPRRLYSSNGVSLRNPQLAVPACHATGHHVHHVLTQFPLPNQA
jgi:hypothetical protein